MGSRKLASIFWEMRQTFNTNMWGISLHTNVLVSNQNQAIGLDARAQNLGRPYAWKRLGKVLWGRVTLSILVKVDIWINNLVAIPMYVTHCSALKWAHYIIIHQEVKSVTVSVATQNRIYRLFQNYRLTGNSSFNDCKLSENQSFSLKFIFCFRYT